MLLENITDKKNAHIYKQINNNVINFYSLTMNAYQYRWMKDSSFSLNKIRNKILNGKSFNSLLKAESLPLSGVFL